MKTIAFCLAMLASTAAYAESPMVVTPGGKYLGNLNANRFDPNSTSNPVGPYGSRFAPEGVSNPFSQYGSRFSPDSANNPFAQGVISPPSGLRD